MENLLKQINRKKIYFDSIQDEVNLVIHELNVLAAAEYETPHRRRLQERLSLLRSTQQGVVLQAEAIFATMATSATNIINSMIIPDISTVAELDDLTDYRYGFL